VLDGFNRANGPLGAGWSGAAGGYAVAANRLDAGAGGDAYWAAGPFGADQEAYVTVVTPDPAAAELDLLLKAQSRTAWGAGLIEVWYDPRSQRVQVWTFAGPQGWVQRGADLPVALAAGDQFGARATADGQVRVYRNGALLGSRDASGWPYAGQGGYVGLWLDGAPNAVLDDFGGGPVAAGP
jgi:hypothetical protein